MQNKIIKTENLERAVSDAALNGEISFDAAQVFLSIIDRQLEALNINNLNQNIRDIEITPDSNIAEVKEKIIQIIQDEIR